MGSQKFTPPPKRQYGIIGYPLGHTLSPLVHNWGFRYFGIEAEYLAWPTPPEALAGFLAKVRATPIYGLSVTIPHKSTVMAYLDEVSDLGRAVGAVNTLFWRDGRLCGENTDIEGFCRPLKERGLRAASALVLGGGGVSRAALAGLKRLGVARIMVANRTAEKAAALAREFGVTQVAWEERAASGASLLVNATPMGMSGKFEGMSPYPAEALASGQVVFDLVYNPYLTRFGEEAKAAGCVVVPGMEMFLYQAVEQFRLWTGEELPVEATRELLMEALYGQG